MLLRQRADIGIERGPWRLGWETREEATLTSDGQTLDFVRLYKQRKKPVASTSYALAAHLERWSAQGPRLARWFDASDTLRLQVAGAVYTRALLRETDVAGSVQYQPVDQYDFNVQRTEANSRTRYPFMREEPGGAGTSVSVALAWQGSADLLVSAKIDDLWSLMRWKNLPLKQERIDSRVSAVDADGYVNYRPRLSGAYRQLDRQSALARSGEASVRYDFGPLALTAGLARLAGTSIPSLALAHRFGWGTVSTRVDTRFGAFGIGVDTGRLQLALQADSLRLSHARALGVSMGLRY